MVSLIYLTSDSHDDSHLCNSAAGPVDDYHLVSQNDAIITETYCISDLPTSLALVLSVAVCPAASN